MTNINITTNPTGRSPENKYFFGDRTSELCTKRPKYYKIGDSNEYRQFAKQMESQTFEYTLRFISAGIRFTVHTNDSRHEQFVRNMFTVNSDHDMPDWTIWHNTELKISEPKIFVHLDKKEMLIAGTTFLGEIKKGVFGIVSFDLPLKKVLPMHCSAFTYNNTTNLMFGLSGTGKTTLSSDPDFRLIGDDEIAWKQDGLHMIETGCYAKSEGLSEETHKTIYDAVALAEKQENLVIENPGVANARLSYPLNCVENAHSPDDILNHPNNVFFLTFDAEGILPAISKIKGETVRLLFETGYTSMMPGTENGINEITKTFSPCYGSPFMPRPIKEYSNLLMKKIKENKCNVFLVNTGIHSSGKRFALELTRNIIKIAINGYPFFPPYSVWISAEGVDLDAIRALNASYSYAESELLPAHYMGAEYKEKLSRLVKELKDQVL
jgi:ATP-dependent phosphoenolpyruvate carboxykinase